MNTNAIKSALIFLSLASSLVGCAGSVADPGGDDSDGLLGIDPTTGLPVLPGANDGPGGVIYKGFGGSTLGLDRATGEAGTETIRIKPFSALSTEYARVLGRTPSKLAGFASTFSSPPANWYEEPTASAISLFSAYQAAFEGCLAFTATDAAYAAVPTPASATTVCGNLATKFWSRSADGSEMATCVDVATVQTANETNAPRKWAYTCAAVLTSAGFLTF